MGSISQLKRSRKKSFEQVNKAIETMSGGYTDPDADKFWKPSRDATDHASAVIRFLPAKEGEDSPFVQYFTHNFQGPGGWYIENCPTSLGKDHDCPMCEANSELWNTGTEAAQNIVRQRKRKQHYVSNVLVIDDSVHPENNGKVFMFKYGVKIFEMIQAAIKGNKLNKPINPFDFWEGANFLLQQKPIKVKMGNKTVKMYSYEESQFGSMEAIADDDDDIQKIWDSQFSLDEYVAPDKFKDYDELQKRVQKALAVKSTGAASAEDAINSELDSDDADDAPWDKEQTASASASASVETESVDADVSTSIESDDEEDGDDYSYFEKLASGE